MVNRIIGCGAKGCLAFAMIVLLGAASARAAGDWEWTEGQGWIMGAGVSRPTPKEQLHYAYELEQRGEFMDSARQYFLLVQNFPASQEAGIGLQRLAKCLFEMENYYTSYKAIEQVIKTYPNTGRMSDLVEIELRIAKRMMLSQTPDLFSSRDDDSRAANVKKALEIVGSVVDHDPYGPVAAEAYLVMGEGNLFVGEINKARTAFEKVRDEFPRSDFVERARLGILRCDSLVGQAKPQELAEQAEVVRRQEAERVSRRSGDADDFDDVEESLKQMNEVEAAKMMEQARQYNRMGTRQAVQAAQFLYKEIARRYPGTSQAEEANNKLGTLKVPKEQGKLAKGIRAINLNPFSWNKDKEPPWIVPQLDPEDQVLVDSGMGPIAGVPETGVPATIGAPGLKPASLDSLEPALDMADAGNSGAFSPAPAFVDGTANYSPERNFSPAPEFSPVPDFPPERNFSPAPPIGQTPYAVSSHSQPRDYYAPPREYYATSPMEPSPAPHIAANPIPTISDDDLVPLGGNAIVAAPVQPAPEYMNGYLATPPYQGGQPAGGYQAQYQAPIPMPDIAPAYPAPREAQPVLGTPPGDPMNDLVGPARRSSTPPPMPDLTAGGYSAPIVPASPPVQDGYGYPYAEPAPASPAQPYYQDSPAVSQGSSGGGWTLGGDFR